jgi:hypothetical protein
VSNVWLIFAPILAINTWIQWQTCSRGMHSYIETDLKSEMIAWIKYWIVFADEDTADTFDPIVDYHCSESVTQWPHLWRYLLNIWCETDPHVKQLYEGVSRIKRLQRLELTLRPRPAYNEWTVELTPNPLFPFIQCLERFNKVLVLLAFICGAIQCYLIITILNNNCNNITIITRIAL